MKPAIWIASLLILAHAHATYAQTVPPEDRETATRLLGALKSSDKTAIAKLIRYPLRRSQPLPPIRNEKEFVDNYGDFFDAETITKIEAEAQDIWNSWRGTAVGGGLVWIEGGKIFAINVTTKRQQKAALAATERVQSGIHPAARNYRSVLFACSTKDYQIRIQDDGKTRYFSWKAGQPLSSKPDLALTGETRFEGTGGNTTYAFKNGEYAYEVEKTVICAEDCNSYLTVQRRGQILLRQACKPQE